ncbi:MAG TPA: mycofactocin-coupled SDR family oxidoreductase [Solirubrobacterales bacterium]|jgi:SDR family mycofactocin-dependent oxidoreductase|nr:mycofactocin-coupled SDR family oxidoreductase [Solirubrobacterales bacterium]
MNRLDGKVAFITGGARGQGRAIAAKFAQEGADIVVSDICADLSSIEYPLGREDDLAETVELVESYGRRCLSGIADVRDQAALDEVVARATAELGGIDIVCPNAGIAGWGLIWELSEQDWIEQIEVNLNGPWRTIKAVAPGMIERGRGGSLIFTSSTNGHEPGPNNSHYTASKHGVLGLMKAAAVELGPYGVRANAVMPGPVMSAMIDNDVSRERFTGTSPGTTAELAAATENWVILRDSGALAPSVIADAMIWLASDESGSVTGVSIPVDAGHLVLAGLDL